MYLLFRVKCCALVRWDRGTFVSVAGKDVSCSAPDFNSSQSGKAWEGTRVARSASAE